MDGCRSQCASVDLRCEVSTYSTLFPINMFSREKSVVHTHTETCLLHYLIQVILKINGKPVHMYIIMDICVYLDSTTDVYICGELLQTSKHFLCSAVHLRLYTRVQS